MKQLTRVIALAGLATLIAAPLQAGGVLGCAKKRSSHRCCVRATPVVYYHAPVVAHAPAAICPCYGSAGLSIPMAASQPAYYGEIATPMATPQVGTYGQIEAPMPAPQAYSYSNNGATVQATEPLSTPRASYSSPTPAPTPATPSWSQAWEAVKSNARSKELSICAFKTEIGPGFTALIDGLAGNQKHEVDEFKVCFPNEATWNANPQLQAEIVAYLGTAGIL